MQESAIHRLIESKQEAEDRLVNEKKKKDKEYITKMIAHFDQQCILKKTQQAKQKEDDCKALQEYTYLLNKQDQERANETQKRLSYFKSAESLRASAIPQRNLASTLFVWPSTEDRKAKILEQMKNKVEHQKKTEAIALIAKQMEEKKQKLQKQRQIDLEFGAINKKLAEDAIKDEIMKQSNIRIRNKMNADYLKKQIEQKKPLISGMSEQEMLLNKKLIQEIESMNK